MKKSIRVVILTVLSLLVLAILFASPIAKYLIEKYDVKFTGRELTLDWAYVNPFTGYVYLNGLKVFEATGDSLFLSAEAVSADFALRKLFSRTVEISELTFDQPWGKIVQRGDTLNFDDLIQKFAPGRDSLPASWHVTLLNTKIVNGEFHYLEKIITLSET
jgi:hypothetical protein